MTHPTEGSGPPAERSLAEAVMVFGAELREAGFDVDSLIPPREPYVPSVDFT